MFTTEFTQPDFAFVFQESEDANANFKEVHLKAA